MIGAIDLLKEFQNICEQHEYCDECSFDCKPYNWTDAKILEIVKNCRERKENRERK